MNKLNKLFLIGVLVLFVVLYFFGRTTMNDSSDSNTLTEEETQFQEELQKELDKLSNGVEEYSFTNDDTVQLRLREMAKEANQQMPMMMGADLRLDNTIALKNKKFRYSYTFVNNKKEEFETPTFSAYLKEYRKTLLNQIKTTPEMKFFRKNKVTLQYTYYDMDGLLIIEFIFTPI